MSGPNRSRFNFMYANCADFTRNALNVLFPGMVHRNILFDAGFTTPKELAAAAHRYAGMHPELGFRVEILPQVPGGLARSAPMRGVTESFVKRTPFLMGLAVLNPMPIGGVIASGLLDHRYNAFNHTKTAPVFHPGGDDSA